MTRDEFVRLYNEGEQDFSSLDLSNIDLSNIELSGIDLAYSELINADLSNADLSDNNLSDTDFTNATLTNANLTGADLWDCKGNGKEIITIDTYGYIINYTFDRMQIGYKNHSHEEWAGFSDAEIVDMDDDALGWWGVNKHALEWWKENKEMIFKEIKINPAIATGHEG